MQASAAAMFGGSPVNLDDGAGPGVGRGFGGGAGLIGSAMLHLEKRQPVLSRQVAPFAFSLSRVAVRRYARRSVNPIRVRAGEQSYEVVVDRGILTRIGSLLLPKFKGAACAVISDENVAALHANTIFGSLTEAGTRPVLITVPPGEASKTMQQAATICDRMIEAGLDRSSFVVAVGGGMVGDLAGFVAAIYHRGIPCVQVPTTLLAQVDSSIGGKTGVNTAAGKNLIGAWHQPALVISDVDTLETLPPREFRQGFAELIKHAVIRDLEMFERLQRFDRADLPALIRRNVEIKAAIVAADEREKTGERALLNFGHTIGHAIERVGNYRDFLHGEAVSLGMVAACEISVRKAGLSEAERERIVRTLEAFELPTRLPADFPKEKILSAVPRDKKFTQGEVRFVVVPAIGSARLVTDVTMADIEGAVEKL
jgi:3-dehydroquinate synthase